jgi:hypothetical protein
VAAVGRRQRPARVLGGRRFTIAMERMLFAISNAVTASGAIGLGVQ